MQITKLTFLILIVIAFNVTAQIPNNGFEKWDSVGKFIEPVSWHSAYSLIDSSGSYTPVTRSTDHYPESIGSYSVKISNDTAKFKTGIDPSFLLGWGFLTSTLINDRPLFPITGHPASLRGYYKFFPQNGDTMIINVHLFKDGVEVSEGSFFSSDSAPKWTPFSADIRSYTNADSARITLSAASEPKGAGRGVHGNSVLYVDNLSFDSLVTSVSENDNKGIPNKFDLVQNFPNPFNPSTVIKYSIPKESFVTIKAFDPLGKEIATLVNEVKTAGYHEVEFNAGNLSSGTYFYQIRANGFIQTKKMLLLR